MPKKIYETGWLDNFNDDIVPDVDPLISEAATYQDGKEVSTDPAQTSMFPKARPTDDDKARIGKEQAERINQKINSIDDNGTFVSGNTVNADPYFLDRGKTEQDPNTGEYKRVVTPIEFKNVDLDKFESMIDNIIESDDGTRDLENDILKSVLQSSDTNVSDYDYTDMEDPQQPTRNDVKEILENIAYDETDGALDLSKKKKLLDSLSNGSLSDAAQSVDNSIGKVKQKADKAKIKDWDSTIQQGETGNERKDYSKESEPEATDTDTFSDGADNAGNSIFDETYDDTTDFGGLSGMQQEELIDAAVKMVESGSNIDEVKDQLSKEYGISPDAVNNLTKDSDDNGLNGFNVGDAVDISGKQYTITGYDANDKGNEIKLHGEEMNDEHTVSTEYWDKRTGDGQIQSLVDGKQYPKKRGRPQGDYKWEKSPRGKMRRKTDKGNWIYKQSSLDYLKKRASKQNQNESMDYLKKLSKDNNK